MVFIVTLILIHEPPSLLQQRFAKTTVKRDSIFDRIFKNLQELLRPFSKKNVQTGQYISNSKKLLLQAGYASSEEDVIKYDARRLASTLVVGAVLLILLMVSFSAEYLIIGIMILFLVYRWPEMKLKREIKFRQREFMKYLPDAVDLLSICVEAGLGIDASFEKVADEFRLTSKVVSVEFSRLNKDILSGLNREDAYKNLILRNENQDLQSFVALLIQTDRLGTSIRQSLDAFCDSMRTKKRQRVEELSHQASTKMTIPMVLFMLPAILIIILYPAVMKIMVNLGG